MKSKVSFETRYRVLVSYPLVHISFVRDNRFYHVCDFETLWGAQLFALMFSYLKGASIQVIIKTKIL